MVVRERMPRHRGRGMDRAEGVLRRAFGPEWVFVVLFMVVAGFAALSVPIGAGLDEPSHIMRVVQIARGGLTPEPVGDGLYGGRVDGALARTLNDSMRRFHTTSARYAFPMWSDPAAGGGARLSGSDALAAFSNSSVYSPVAYLPYLPAVWLGVMSGSIVVLVLGMRLSGVLFLAIVLFWCIRRIPVGKWMLVVLALMPECATVTACVSADVMTMSTVTVFLTCVLRLAIDSAPSCADSVGAVVAGAALGLVKLAYLPVLLLLLLPAVLRADAGRIVRRLAAGCAVMAMCSLPAFLWYLLVRGVNIGLVYGRATDPAGQLAYVASHPWRYMRLLAGDALTHDYLTLAHGALIMPRSHLPAAGYVFAPALLLSVGLRDTRERTALLNKRLPVVAILALTAFAATFLLIETADYLQFNPVAAATVEGVQERYFIPVDLLLLIPLSLVTSLGSPSGAEGDLVPAERTHVDVRLVVAAPLLVIPAALTILSTITAVYR